MTEAPNVVEILFKTLNQAQRPLSVRRLLRLCRDAGHSGGVWTNKGVELILRQSVEFFELRPGVFTTQSQLGGQRNSIVSSAPSSVLPVLVETDNTPIFPESMSDVVALRDRFGGRDSLKRFLAGKMTERLSQMEHDSTSRRGNAVATALPRLDVESCSICDKRSVILPAKKRLSESRPPKRSRNATTSDIDSGKIGVLSVSTSTGSTEEGADETIEFLCPPN